MTAPEHKPCCMPARTARPAQTAGALSPALSAALHPEQQTRGAARAAVDTLVLIPGQQFLMGTSDQDGFPDDGEGPPRQVVLDAFFIAPTVVTNRQFSDFVRDTHYITEAERFGASFVFQGQVRANDNPNDLDVPPGLPWWRVVAGASWQRPEGPGSHIHERSEHPVVHISWQDAQAYCNWSGQRLPTEAQWECAARGGLHAMRYPWGNALLDGDRARCNIWQGEFPNGPAPGWTAGPVPARSFEPNGYGLYNMAGNVWEWCEDTYTPAYHQFTEGHNPVFLRHTGRRSMRGGSFLCHASYCNRYRVAARNGNTPESTASNCGFRVAASASDPQS